MWPFGKTEQKARYWLRLVIALTLSPNKQALGPVGSGLSFPISHCVSYRMLYLWRAFDLLRLEAWTLQFCKPQSVASVCTLSPSPSASFLLPLSLVKIQPRGLQASSVFFSFFLLSNSAGACLSFLIYSFFFPPLKSTWFDFPTFLPPPHRPRLWYI